MKRSFVLLGLVAVGFSLFIVGRLLAPNDFNPTTTIKFGEIFAEQNEYASALLGDIVVAPMAGHDGKYFFTQAMDPFYLEPDVHATYLDRPSYRAQRMAYPTLASIGGLASPTVTAWGLIFLNVAAMTIGTIYTGLVATRMGLSAMFGLAFLLNPGVLVDLTIDGAGIVALAAMMAGVFYAMEDKIWLSAIAMSVASLARETMLIAAAGLGLYLWFRQRRIPWRMSLPVISVAAWWAYVHWRLEDGLSQDVQALGLPLAGFVEAFRGWIDRPDTAIDLALGLALVSVSVMVVIRSILTPTALGWSTAGFAILGLMMSEPVWRNWFDASRALAPVVTAFILIVAMPNERAGRSVAPPASVSVRR